MKILWILFLIVLSSTSLINADVIEKDVITGLTTQRPYTQKELDDIAANATLELQKETKRAKALDITVKRETAIEKILMSGVSVESIAYQDAVK